uniref:Uncharacterized protein n=1 Tax=Anguilla anguilla TaxID=7936 RepID=A0A0E9WLD5_ANGAN
MNKLDGDVNQIGYLDKLVNVLFCFCTYCKYSEVLWKV